MAFTVSATMSNNAFGMGLKVFVLTGAVEAGGASAGQTASPPDATLTPNASNSLPVFCGYNESNSTSYVQATNNTLDDNIASPGSTQTCDGRYTGTVTSGTGITVGCSTPTGNNTSVAIYEIKPSGGTTPVVDGSTPAIVTGNSPQTTASFSPPNQSTTVLVACVTCASLTGNTAGVSDTSGLGLTWTQRAAFQNTSTGTASYIFTATMPGAGAAISGTVQPLAAQPAPRRKLARAVWARITGSAFAAVPAPRQVPPIPRRVPARSYVRGSAPFTGFAAVPAPRQAPYLPPRRPPARAYWRGSAPFTGFTQVAAPRQAPYLPPRRKPARGIWGGPALPPVFVPVPAPRQLPVFPRRVPARAYVRFTPVSTTNAPFKPRGAPPAAPDDKPQLKKILLLLG